jgi:hypothetical protein
LCRICHFRNTFSAAKIQKRGQSSSKNQKIRKKFALYFGNPLKVSIFAVRNRE